MSRPSEAVERALPFDTHVGISADVSTASVNTEAQIRDAQAGPARAHEATLADNAILPSPVRRDATLPTPAGVRRGLDTHDTLQAWKLSIFSGRLGEISGAHNGAALTMAFRLVLEAQRRNEPVAWISRRGSAFYPPDAAEIGIDLAALAVIWVDDLRDAARAADYLIRSGAFGLVLLDCGPRAQLAIPVQSRLVGLAKKHDTALLCLTEKGNEHPSIGSLVAVRAEASRTEKQNDRFRCEIRILKDKRRGPGWTHVEICHGPEGLS